MSAAILVRPHMAETSALGAAVAAGVAEGVNVWDLKDAQSPPSDTFRPRTTEVGKHTF